MAEHGKDYPKTDLICMLPNWIKKILLRYKTESIEGFIVKNVEQYGNTTEVTYFDENLGDFLKEEVTEDDTRKE
jgi:hypothetical protein